MKYALSENAQHHRDRQAGRQNIIVYKTNGHKRPPTFINREFAAGLFKTHRFKENFAFSIRSVFWKTYAINACGSLGKIKT